MKADLSSLVVQVGFLFDQSSHREAFLTQTSIRQIKPNAIRRNMPPFLASEIVLIPAHLADKPYSDRQNIIIHLSTIIIITKK